MDTDINKKIFVIFLYLYIYIYIKTYETTINAVLHKEKQILNYVLTTSKRISRFLKKKPTIPNPNLKKKKKKIEKSFSINQLS
jgi:hypothetical protein